MGLSQTPKLSTQVQRKSARTFFFCSGLQCLLFGIFDECSSRKYDFVYGEENNSKGANNVASILYFYLMNIASDQVKFCDHLIIFLDGCRGENKNRTTCAFLRVFLETKFYTNLRKIAIVYNLSFQCSNLINLILHYIQSVMIAGIVLSQNYITIV